MADRLDRILNTLVAVSTCIVALLVYDRTDTMMAPYSDAAVILDSQPTDISIQNLTNNCTNVWQSHKLKDAKSISSLHTKPKYSSKTGTTTNKEEGSFCSRIPKDLSAAHLWNEHLDGILQSSSNEEEIASHLLTAKLLQFLTPSKYLERGYRSRPSRLAWGRLLRKINDRLTSKNAPLVHVVAFGAGSINCEVVEPGLETPLENSTQYGPEQEIDCLWPVRLEGFLNHMFNRYLPQGEQRAIINITPMYHPPNIATTAEFDTAVVKHGAWESYVKEHGGPDVIISAFNAHDMFLPNRGWNTANDIEYYHHQRQIIQDFMRTCLEVQSCTRKETPKMHAPPLLISVDNYVGNQHGPVMAENVQARVLQLLSDYYETAFVSYAEVIRKLVYASDEDSPLEHASVKDWTSDWTSLSATSPTTAQSNIIQHGMVGPIAMTMTLAYSFLKYTVSFCSDQSAQANNNNNKSDNLISEEVIRLAEEVLPPELNTDLSLTNVTYWWKEEKAKEDERNELCKMNAPQENTCVFEFWGGTQGTKVELDEHLGAYVQGEMVGWEARHGGRLFATEENASLHLRFNLPKKGDWSIRLFSVFRDNALSDATRLQWEISVLGGRRTRRQLLPRNVTSFGAEPRRFLKQQSGTITGTIDGTHDSPAVVALPTTIDIDTDRFTSAVDLKLQLIEGDTFEIVGMFFCNSR